MGRDAPSLVLTIDLAFVYLGSHMKYRSGHESRLGDRIRVGGDSFGVIVCSVDTHEYSPKFSRGATELLGHRCDDPIRELWIGALHRARRGPRIPRARCA